MISWEMDGFLNYVSCVCYSFCLIVSYVLIPYSFKSNYFLNFKLSKRGEKRNERKDARAHLLQISLISISLIVIYSVNISYLDFDKILCLCTFTTLIFTRDSLIYRHIKNSFWRNIFLVTLGKLSRVEPPPKIWTNIERTPFNFTFIYFTWISWSNWNIFSVTTHWNLRTLFLYTDDKFCNEYTRFSLIIKTY